MYTQYYTDRQYFIIIIIVEEENKERRIKKKKSMEREREKISKINIFVFVAFLYRSHLFILFSSFIFCFEMKKN
jgi:hypothetical protein